MENIKLEAKCPHCSNKLRLNFNSWTHELALERPDVTPYRDKMTVVEHYKKIKGYDKLKTWDQAHRERAFGYAKQLLAACGAEVDPASAAKDAITWAQEEARRKAVDWNLGTVVKWSGDFLVALMARKNAIALPKCQECHTRPAADGAKFCGECSWCWKCSDAGRKSEKNPLEMVGQKDTPPVCQGCAK